ncbi:MAG: maleylpyruvate isomerase family mycothiol-dependent enzyme [Actinomycetota bacterium]
MVDTSDVSDADPFEAMDAESERLHRFFSSLTDDEWLPGTRCEGWRRREIVAHLAGGDTYHTACLDDTVQDLFAEGARAGATGGDAFNAWMVDRRADRSAQDVLDEWWRLNSDVRTRMRERGRDGSMSSSVGPYPVGLMGFHLASEYATHYDDVDGPLTDAEREARTSWRYKVSRFALKETEKPVEVEERGDGCVVRAAGKEATLTRYEFVEAVTARLKTIDVELQGALRALA